MAMIDCQSGHVRSKSESSTSDLLKEVTVERIGEISKEWLEQWSEIQKEVEKTCARIAKEMGKMRTALDTITLAELKREIQVDKEVLERLTRLREQVTGVFGHISEMSEKARGFRKKLEKFSSAAGDQMPRSTRR